MFDRGEVFDPLKHYGLDGDPPRPPGVQHEEAPPGIDILSPLEGERRGARSASLGSTRWAELPPRLYELAWWCAAVRFEPATLWWAARQPSLHPDLQLSLARELGRPAPAEHAVLTGGWRLLLEAARDLRDIRREWYELREQAARDGWTNTHLRTLAEVLRPRLMVNRHLMGRPEPPAQPEPLRRLVQFDVAFLETPTSEVAFPPEVLSQVTAIWRQALVQGASLAADAAPISWETPTLHPERRPGQSTQRKGGVFFLHFARLFEELAAQDPGAARHEADQWPQRDRFFFEKLRTWVWRRADLFAPAETADGLLRLDDDAFWGPGAERELLWTLRGRWADFAPAQRRGLETRIVAGPSPWPGEPAEAADKRRSYDAAVRLGWLEREGCALSPATLRAMPRLRRADSSWSARADERADASREGRVGWVRTETDPSALRELPLSQILSAAAAASGLEHEAMVRSAPFAGLVKLRPARALAALAFAGRAGRPVVAGWRTFLEAQDLDYSPRLRALAAARVANLQQDALRDLRHEVTRWVGAVLRDLASEQPALAWKLWDAVLNALTAGGEAVTGSDIGEESIGGEKLDRSRRTAFYAADGPMGSLTEAALDVLDTRPRTRRKIVPPDVMQRLEATLASPGEGADHAVVALFRHLSWLDGWDPAFVRQRLLPLLDPANPFSEPAWSGILATLEPLAPRLFKAIQPRFLAVFHVAGAWRWAEPFQGLAAWMVSVRALAGPPMLTDAEVAAALQAGREPACAAVLGALIQQMNFLDRVVWGTARKLLRAWPQELALQTPRMVGLFFDLAIEADLAFPDAVDAVLRFLQPTETVGLYHLSMQRVDDGPPLAQRFPLAALKLVNAVVGEAAGSSTFDLKGVLAIIAEAEPDLRTDPRWRRLNRLTGH